MTIPVGVLSLTTASPPHDLPQDEAAEAARRLYAQAFPDYERMARVFQTAGIRTRQSAMPLDWYLKPRNWPDRAAAYAEAALALYINVAGAALEQAELRGKDIDILLTVSSTGIATPSLEARAMSALGFRADASRVPVFGLGCAGGVTGLALASRLAAAERGKTVLVVCVELCTLSFSTAAPSKADIVAAALFGDGAAACVLRADAEGFAQVTGLAEHTWPDSLDVMGWRVDPEGLGVIFAQSIPPFVRRRLRPAMDAMLRAQGLETAEVDRFICHPGGMKVIEALETSLQLGQGALTEERQVLSDHGNMSAPTALFVLDRVRRGSMPALSVLTALGPGFTASTVTLAA